MTTKIVQTKLFILSLTLRFHNKYYQIQIYLHKHFIHIIFTQIFRVQNEYNNTTIQPDYIQYVTLCTFKVF